MSHSSLRIVFLGTPEFASTHLATLIKASYQVVGVVTMPDKPAGRGKKLTASPVKMLAQEHGIPVLQPSNLKDNTFLSNLKALKADLQIVVAFRMLPEAVWNMPPLGTINVHASLLPDYRGAAPIQWAIINGEDHTGVTTFQLQHEIDTGDLLVQQSIPISTEDTAGSLHDKLMHLGTEALLETLEQLKSGKLKPAPQQAVNKRVKRAPKLTKANTQIDWNASAKNICNKIRGLSPYPGAWTKAIMANGRDVVIKLHGAKPAQHQLPAGTVEQSKTELFVGCTSGSVQITELQYPGKKRLPTRDFLNGFQSTIKNCTS